MGRAGGRVLAVRTLVVAKSRNSKTGQCACTYRPQLSCLDTCALYESGCYALGRIFSFAKRGSDDMDAVRALIDQVPYGGLIRLNVSGDFLDEDGSPDMAYIEATNDVARARPDVTFIAYTHAWRVLSPDLFEYTVAASCDSLADIYDAYASGWPPVTVDPGGDESLIGTTLENGRRVIQCPAQNRDITCEQCRLCARPERALVAFSVHGSGKKKAAQAIRDRRAA